MRAIGKLFVICAMVMSVMACQTGKNEKNATAGKDTTLEITADTLQAAIDQEKLKDSPPAEKVSSKEIAKTGLPVVLVYNFHVTNRCVSCIAIEEATTKTLNTYFATELKQGRIKRQVIDVDDKANQKIAEKYEAFGSGLFVTRVYNGKETTTDLTGDGFKFAKNKEERFIEILKSKITEYLK